MLTCKVGENIINTINYTDDQIRKWSKKGILKCPICGGELIYKNGEFKIAHFAHKDGDECVDIFGYERDTEEHLNAISDLYKRFQEIELLDDNLKNVELEYWIPSTKQRGDISFIYKNQRYIIEMQCSPISTKYMERHRLYELSGIKDIWILGSEKYADNKTVDGYFKTKEIERQLLYQENQNLLYYNYKTKLMSNRDRNDVDALLDRKTTFNFSPIETELDNINIEEIIFNSNIINYKQTILSWFDINVKHLCTKVNYNHYIKLMDRNVLIYFEIDSNKYVFDYLNYYVNKEGYNSAINEYKDTKISPFLFLNYSFYKHAVKDGMQTYDDYWKYRNIIEYTCYWQKFIIDLIGDNMLFISNNHIHTFNKVVYKISDINNYVPLLNKTIENLSHIPYNSKDKIIEAYEKDKIYGKSIFDEYINEKSNDIKDILKKFLRENKSKSIFEKFSLSDILFLDGRVVSKNYIPVNDYIKLINKEIDNLIITNLIYDKLQVVILEGLKESILKKERLKQNHVKDKEHFDQLSIKIVSIFDNSKDRILEYKLGYSVDDNINDVIWFKDYKNREFIMYCDFYNNNKNDYKSKMISPSDLPNMKLIKIKRHYSYGNMYVIESDNSYAVYDHIPTPSYKYDTYFKENISDINLSFKRLDNNWVSLPRYNFINMSNVIKKIQDDVEKIIEDYVDFYSISEKIIYSSRTITNDAINENIRKALYPMTCISNKNIDHKLNITLNIDFTRDSSGKLKPWLIKDFITSLESIGIDNIYNII